MKKISAVSVLIILPISLVLLFTGCGENKIRNNTGMALIDIDFNNRVENMGLANVDITGEDRVSYATGLKDTCFDLSITSKYRMPVIISSGYDNSLNDHKEFTVEIWAKKVSGDDQNYVIAGSKEATDDSYTGWEIGTSENGSWYWSLSNGSTHWSYDPTSKVQSMNDDRWHQLAFSFNRNRDEVRLYFDGINRAVYSLTALNSNCILNKIFIGSDPLAIDLKIEAFNGFIDGFRFWGRALKDVEVKELYEIKTGIRINDKQKKEKGITVMTWNIWNGGRQTGKTVGIQRVTDIIRNSGADVILLQETDGSGEKIADALGYKLFYRSPGLNVISRFSFGRSYNIFSPQNFGCVNIIMGEDEILFCPVMLNSKPDIGAYIKTGNAIPDSIIDRELQTRGLQMRFILGELSSFAKAESKTFVVAGDFNSGSHLDWTGRNKSIHHDLVVDFPVSKMMQDQGFIDPYRALHPDETADPGITWSPVFKNTLQDRIDYIYFKGNKLKPVTSYVINSYSYEFPSDHAAVITVFFLNND